MLPNFLVIGACSLIPFFIAYAWYHPKVFGGDTWAKVAGHTKEQRENPVSPIQLGLSILLNFLIAFGIYNFTVHASGVFGLMGGETESLKTGTALAFLQEHGKNFTTFGHGLVHGFAATLLFVIPLEGYTTIFGRKSGKYFLITVGYWLVSLMLTGGIISVWGWKSIV